MDWLRSKNLKFLVKVSISTILLSFIFYHVGWSKLFLILSRVDLFLLGLTIVFNAFGVLISVLKWKSLLEVQGIREPLYRLHSIYYIGFFFNNFLPSMVGGDFIRVMKTAGKKQKRTEALCAVLTERMTGLGAMLCLAGMAAVWNLYHEVPVGISWLAISALGLIGLLLLAWGFLMLLSHQSKMPVGFFRLLAPLIRLKGTLADYSNYPNVLIKAFILSSVFHALLVINGYLFARSIGLDLDIIVLGVIFPATMLVSMIPISLNGFGIKEGSLIILLGQIGVGREEALIIAALSRLFVILASIAGGILYVLDRPSISPSIISKTSP